MTSLFAWVSTLSVFERILFYNMKFNTPYTAPTLNVDAVIFQLGASGLEVLLAQRQHEPFAGKWALPGGYNAVGHTTQQALQYVVIEKAGVNIEKDVQYIEQLYTFDTIARDPRGHAVSVTYMGCGRGIPINKSDRAAFFELDKLPELAFDHADIIAYSQKRLINKLGSTNAVYGLLPEKFTLTQLQNAYEAVYGRPLDKRNFRKKFLTLNLIHATNESWRDGAHRPAKLYAFNSKTIESLARRFD